ncbi:uncharacterized protein LOC142633209 [Castanea sativa]|uniref:uncharacterized protein LOC142633209 n=1 Tax=Castanea sativa TaxID=21020 RepID=UPI003F651AD9
MVLHRGSDRNLKGSRRKKKGMVDNSNCRPWSELPEALLDLITKSLGVIDYLMIGCVCKGWRLYVGAHRKEFMASQPPLLVLVSSYARRTCYFYSIFDQKLYKAILLDLVGKRCSGVSCGYFVMEDKKKSADSQIWFLNPFTRHELRFSSPPNPYLSIILASLATPLQEFVIIAIDVFFLQFRKSTDVNWTVYDYRDLFKDHFTDYSRWLLDGAVFNGKIYLLTNHGEIGVVRKLNPHPYVAMLEIESMGYRSFEVNLQLLALDDKLLMICRNGPQIQREQFQVFELNFSMMKWVKMENFNDQDLFLRHRSSGFSNVTKWSGSRQPMNCIYNLGISDGICTLHFLDDRDPKPFPSPPPQPITRASSGAPFWYFPNLSGSVDALYDD